MNERVYLSRREQYGILAKIALPYFAFFWLYFRIDHFVPMLVDILILPMTLAVALLAARYLERGRLWGDPGDERQRNPRTNRIRILMCWTGAPFYWVLWVSKRHGDSLPETIFIPLFALALAGLFTSAALAVMHTVMVLIDRRRRRSMRANTS